MAKKGNVKKGFATYLMILLLAIVAAFFIIVVIMLFSPFKNILGFRYFMYKDVENYCVYSDTISTEKMNYDSSSGKGKKVPFYDISKISIDCDFSDVRIERGNYDQCYIRVDQHCAGIAREDMDTDFVVEIKYTSLSPRYVSIKVREPEGFVYFNKNICISLLIPQQKVEGYYNNDGKAIKYDNTKSFNTTTIEINSKRGSIYLGNKSGNNNSSDVENYSLTFGNLDIKNTSGDIIAFDTNKNPSDLKFVQNNMTIKTTSGSVDVRRNLDINNLNIYSSKGKLSFKNGLKIAKGNFDLGNSDFNISTLQITNELDFAIRSGYFTANKIIGTFTSNRMTSDMGSANIRIYNLFGTLSLPNTGNSKIKIDATDESSNIYIRGRGSRVNIDKLMCYAWIETTSGAVTVTAGHDEATSKQTPYANIKTTSGTINYSYNAPQLPNSQTELYSSNGRVNLTVRSALAFRLYVVDTNGNARTGENVSVEGYDRDITFPHDMNGGNEQSLKITSNKNVSVTFY